MSFKYETITDPIFLKVAEHQGDKDFCWVTPESKAPLASDIKQHPCVITSRYKNHDTKIKEFEVRHDDVWVISYPKSGSTWCQEMIWLLMNNLNYERALNENIGQRFPFLEFGAVRDLPADVDPFKQANEMKSPRFIKSHLPVSLLPDQIWTVKPKLVYIRRNPKDVGVSYFHHSATLHDYGGPIEDFMDLFLADLALFSPYHSHVIEYHSLNNANILLLSFEDMKKDLALVIRDSMAFLNRSYSTDQIEELCKHLSLDSMKKNKAVNLEEWIKYCLSISKKTQVDVENAKFIRKGQVGGWKSELAPELSKRFDEWTMEKVKDDSLRKLFLNDI